MCNQLLLQPTSRQHHINHTTNHAKILPIKSQPNQGCFPCHRPTIQDARQRNNESSKPRGDPYIQQYSNHRLRPTSNIYAGPIYRLLHGNTRNAMRYPILQRLRNPYLQRPRSKEPQKQVPSSLHRRFPSLRTNRYTKFTNRRNPTIPQLYEFLSTRHPIQKHLRPHLPVSRQARHRNDTNRPNPTIPTQPTQSIRPTHTKRSTYSTRLPTNHGTRHVRYSRLNTLLPSRSIFTTTSR